MALTKDTPIKVVEGLLQTFLVYQAVKIFQGAMVFKNSSGYACVTAGGNAFLGHAYAQADNSGGDSGAEEVFVRRGPYVAQVTLNGVAITDRGANVYASDDGTLTLTPTANSLVGKVDRYHSANTADVIFQPAVSQQTAIAAAKVDYATGDLDAEAEIIAALNTTNGKINTLITELVAAGVLASS